MRSYELFTRFTRTETTHHVTLYRQSNWRALIHKLYHWYDWNIEKIPGVKLVEGWINKRRLKKGWLIYVPTWANRDIKCYHLRHKGRVELITFDLTEEQYESLK